MVQPVINPRKRMHLSAGASEYAAARTACGLTSRYRRKANITLQGSSKVTCRACKKTKRYKFLENI